MATFKYQIISNRSFFFVKVFTIIDVVSFNQGLVVCNASQIGYHYKGPCLGCWQATIYTKNCHNLIIFSTYPSFMHRSENLKNYFSLKFCNRLWFIFQSSIMLWNQCTYEWYNNPKKIILSWKTLSHFCNSNKMTKKYYI
jgi:hypothetical protein